MKKLLLICLAVFASSVVSAQSMDDSEMKIVQDLWGKEKKKAVEEFLALEEGESTTAFWAIYDEYEDARKVLGKQRFDIINEYLDVYSEISDEKAAELMKGVFSYRKGLASLQEKTYKKIAKSNGAKMGALFIQIENHFDNAVDMALGQTLPYAGEQDGE
ncbi:MAG: hypothetical protein JXR07_08915 [Reichenbachiella sp.]